VLSCPPEVLGEQKRKADVIAKDLRANGEIADELVKVIKLWGKSEKGVSLLDEVDLLLHPLKSELNFPVNALQCANV